MAARDAPEPTRPEGLLVHLFFLPALLYCASAAAYSLWIEPNAALAALNVAALLAVAANEALFLWHKSVDLAKNVFAGIGVLCLVPMFATGGVGGAGIVWYFAYLVFVFSLTGPRAGIVWSSVLVLASGIVLAGMARAGAPMPYSPMFLLDALWAFLLSLLLVYLLNRAYARSQERLEEKNEELAKAAETSSRLAAVVESAHDPIVSLGLDGRVGSWNAAAERVFARSARDAVGTPVGLVFAPEKKTDETTILDAVRLGTTIDLVTRGARPDGTLLDLHLSLAPVRDGSGTLVGASLILRDVTERKRAEAQSREIERLKELDEYKTSLLSMVGHELKTPITPLKLQIQLLENGLAGPLNERQQKSVAILSRNLDRLAKLVQQTLEVARIQGGRLQIEATSTPLRPLVAEVVEVFEPSAKGTSIRLVADEVADVAVHADAARTTQVLYNLVSNAIKFTPPGGTVAVRASIEGEWAVVRVRDTGIGVAPEHKDQLFQPFGRIEDAVDGKKEGTGLGLYISKAFIEQHGGRLECQSDGPGKGSTFTFTLPLFHAAAR